MRIGLLVCCRLNRDHRAAAPAEARLTLLELFARPDLSTARWLAVLSLMTLRR